MGGIIRDDKGKMVTAYIGAIEGNNALAAELQELIKGVSICKSFAIKQITIESDCLILVENLHKAEPLPWEFMKTWGELLDLLAEFDTREKSVCCRMEKRVVDGQAKLAYPIMTVFRTYLPPSINELYHCDKLWVQPPPMSENTQHATHRPVLGQVDQNFYHVL